MQGDLDRTDMADMDHDGLLVSALPVHPDPRHALPGLEGRTPTAEFDRHPQVSRSSALLGPRKRNRMLCLSEATVPGTDR